MARENWGELFAQNNPKNASSDFDNEEWTWEDNTSTINETHKIKNDIIIDFQKQGIIVERSTLTFVNGLTLNLTNDQIDSLNNQHINSYR
ncbi:hypothetical protein FXV77_21660 [Sphingobacterium phlebotomi]|uniref:Uncharacterized protein n=1 Tax=Sphingobacterium phlebotomi TaxID=2605433 RepID=A0A5D4GR56_9SPHI|nr:hypothetical protein [Sphingobacterium phlebotomi]TYR30808.1 hypothetical protein FXV77_21660 [Sphingobacterium phlebotomi]